MPSQAEKRVEVVDFASQPGPQSAFLGSSADIAIYGGAAGGGKTYGLLLEAARHQKNAKFGAVIFRRTYPDIVREGGLWDEAQSMYSVLGATLKSDKLLVAEFPSGARVSFSHMQHDKDRLSWQGAQIPLICFDELTHFSRLQFMYMLSRNRSTCGVRPYIRATCNPDPDSFVRDLIDWWIDPDTGYAIPERAGVVRWFSRDGDSLVWHDEKTGEFDKSFTFIPAKIEDNPALLSKDPGYLSNLHALPRVEREQLLGGNWNIRATAGSFFRREYFEVVDAAPADARRVRFWDLAATDPDPNKDPDWTAGARMSVNRDGVYFIEHIERMQGTPGAVEKCVKQVAMLDGTSIPIGIEQEPGASGVAVIDSYVRKILPGWYVRGIRSTGPKIERAKPVSAQAEVGNVKLVNGPWVRPFLDEAESFPPPKDTGHDDQVDGVSGAFAMLVAQQEAGGW